MGMAAHLRQPRIQHISSDGLLSLHASRFNILLISRPASCFSLLNLLLRSAPCLFPHSVSLTSLSVLLFTCPPPSALQPAFPSPARQRLSKPLDHAAPVPASPCPPQPTPVDFPSLPSCIFSPPSSPAAAPAAPRSCVSPASAPPAGPQDYPARPAHPLHPGP